MVPTILHKIGPKIDNISFESANSTFQFPRSGMNLFELFQIWAKRSRNLGSVPDQVEIRTGRSMCPGL